uniref:BPI2 domain-containing protein n=1 Tax=Rhabditophanes sp. KR3021 TaxID=114890 RepID=A0AC35TMK4_9BILA
MIPGQLCGQLPQIVNEKLNAKLTGLPQSLSLLQIKDTIVGMMSATPGHCAAPTCAGLRSAGAKQEIVPLPAVSQQPALIQPPVLAQQSPLAQPQFVQQHPQLVQATQQVPQQMAQQMPQQMAQRPPQYPRQHSSAVAHGQSIRYMSMPVNHPGYIYQQQQHQRIARAISFAMNSESIYQLVKKAKLFGSVTSASNPCSGCPGGGVAEDPLTQAGKLLEYLDWNKVSNLDLTLQLLNTYATSNDFTVEVNGEFSPGGQGGTPFGPFPLQFPYSQSDKMVDAVISDFTLNSLFYHAHRAGFFSVRLDSKTPKLGSLLKTSCGDDDETGLEDHGVETDEEATRRRRFKMLMRGVKTVIENSNHHHQERRVKRAEGDDALAGLGVCFGDILPQIRETYPNKNLVVNIRTTTAPSVLLSALNGGSVTAYLDADAEIFIDGNNPLQRVGTISISAIVTANLRAVSSKLMGSLKITKLTLKDKDGTLGLPADALVNLAALGKDLLEKAGNDILSKGLTISIPANTGLPIDIVAPQIQIVEHGVYLAADFTINPLALSSLTSGGASQGGCRRYLF